MKNTLLILLYALIPLTGKGEPIGLNEPLEINLQIHQGAVALDFDTDDDKFYQIEFSTDLVKWDIEGYSFKGTGGRLSKVASGRGQAKAFYRVSDEGDPKNILIGNPSRVWVAETASRTPDVNYTNNFGYEICLYVRVGVASTPDSGASRPIIQTRKDASSPWMTVGGTRTSSRFLQQEGDISATIPAGWQYMLTNGAPGSGLPVQVWNELK